MPQPVKPPMTLKEAKRAYKKDGPVVRYTASQMARADRIDAREAKRRKELEKEKQRAENKRKREQKEERDRHVRQKMLEEGRIGVEDTWGKVTASQPRLSHFFGRNAITKSRLGVSNNAKDQEDGKEVGGNGNDVEQVAQDPNRAVSQTPVHDLPNPTHEDVASPHHHQSSPSHSQSRALGQLSPPRTNARSQSQPKPSSQHKLTPVRNTWSTDSATHHLRNTVKVLSTSSCASDAPAPHSSPGDALEASPTSKPVTRQDETRQATAKESTEEPGHSPLLSTGPHSKKCYGENRWSLYQTEVEDEDFTDGIDDDTFLQLCATQKASGAASPRAIYIDFSVLTPDTTRPVSTEREGKLDPVRDNVGAEGILPSVIPRGLTESFNSVFNEIEDDDFLALAEEVEAELVTPRPTSVAVPMQSIKKEAEKHGKAPLDSGAPQEPALLTSSRIPPPIAPNPRPIRMSSDAQNVTSYAPGTGPPGTEPPYATPKTKAWQPRPISVPTTSQNVQQRQAALPPPMPPPKNTNPKRQLPASFNAVDEFPTLGFGPGTQACVLELMQKVEAQMG